MEHLTWSTPTNPLDARIVVLKKELEDVIETKTKDFNGRIKKLEPVVEVTEPVVEVTGPVVVGEPVVEVTEPVVETTPGTWVEEVVALDLEVLNADTK